MHTYVILFIIFLGCVVLLLPMPAIRRNLIYFIIPVNVVADALTAFAGSEASLHSGILRAPIIILITLFYLHKVRTSRVTNAVIVFLVYLGILILFSSNFGRSLNTFLKVFLAFSMIPIAYYSIVRLDDFRKLQLSLVIGVILLLINYFLAQVFHLGEKVYSEDAAYLGGNGIYITYIFDYALVSVLLSVTCLQSKRSQYLVWFIHILAAVVVLITFRRGSILAPMFGYMIIFILGNWKIKRQVLSALALVAIAFLILLPVYGDLISALYEQRVTEGIHVELDAPFGRVNETREVWTEFLNKGVIRTLFGTELFNSIEYFLYWSTNGRTIHVDYNILAHGSGLIGLFLFFLIFGLIGKSFFDAQSFFPSTKFYNRLKPVFWAVLGTGFVLSLSNQLWHLTSYSCFCLLMGAMLRMATNAQTVNAIEKRRMVQQTLANVATPQVS
jgi:hypothetical protein